MSKVRDVLSKLLLLKRVTDGSLGAEPPAAGDYGDLGAKPSTAGQVFVVFWKKSYFNATGSHFARVQSHLEELEHLIANWKN